MPYDLAVNAGGQVAAIGTYTSPITLGNNSLTTGNQVFVANLKGTTTPTPPHSTPTTPVFLGETRIYTGKGKHKKLVGFQLAVQRRGKPTLAASNRRASIVSP